MKSEDVTHMLYSDEVRSNERNVVDLPEHFHDPGVIDSWYQDSKEICKQCRLFLEIEGERLVIAGTQSVRYTS